MSEHPLLVMGAAISPVVAANREVLLAIEVSPAFMRRAYELRRICRRYVLDNLESPLVEEVIYVDTEPGSALAGMVDIQWTWDAASDWQRWRIGGFWGPEGDQDFATLATTDFVQLEQLQRLVRSKRRYLYSGRGSDPELDILDRGAEGWRRFAELNFSLPPFGWLGPG